MIITEELLKKYNACEEGIAWFNKLYPYGIEIPKGVKKFTIQDDEKYVDWFLKFNLIKDMTIKLEYSDGFWCAREYNSKGLQTRYEDYYGYSSTREYNSKGLQTRYETYDGNNNKIN